MHACQVASVMSDSIRPHGQQPTRLLRPQDSPGKSTVFVLLWPLKTLHVFSFLGFYIFSLCPMRAVPSCLQSRPLFAIHIYALMSFSAQHFLSTSRLCFPDEASSKEPACNAGDLGSIPGSGRSPGEGYGNSLQYSCLENSNEMRSLWATVHRVTQSRT